MDGLAVSVGVFGFGGFRVSVCVCCFGALGLVNDADACRYSGVAGGAGPRTSSPKPLRTHDRKLGPGVEPKITFRSESTPETASFNKTPSPVSSDAAVHKLSFAGSTDATSRHLNLQESTQYTHSPTYWIHAEVPLRNDPPNAKPSRPSAAASSGFRMVSTGRLPKYFLQPKARDCTKGSRKCQAAMKPSVLYCSDLGVAQWAAIEAECPARFKAFGWPSQAMHRDMFESAATVAHLDHLCEAALQSHTPNELTLLGMSKRKKEQVLL